MTIEIEFSVMEASAVGLQPLLDEFESMTHIHVRLNVMVWDRAWSNLVKYALYNDGPDVSEVGSTWLGDLVAVNSVMALKDYDPDRRLPAAAFVPVAWQTCQLVGQPQMAWAVPWVTGARLIVFRRALLAQAGVDEKKAFNTTEQLAQTLERLQACGVQIPWTVPTGLTHTTLLNVASWVWGAGGDFITPDGKEVLFNHPEAQAGMCAYFSLGRHLPPPVQHLTGLEPDHQFLHDPHTAMTISGPWVFGAAREQYFGTYEQLGVALPPGPSFVGGSHLVMWKHSRNQKAALELIHFLSQPSVQVVHSQQVGLLPARVEALAMAPFATDPFWQMAIRGLKTGRSFPMTRSWGLIEDRLTTEFSRIWEGVWADPSQDIAAVIARRLVPLAQRLELVLGGS
jgi:multiple sugar transport system substrate-binding protein